MPTFLLPFNNADTNPLELTLATAETLFFDALEEDEKQLIGMIQLDEEKLLF